MKTVLPSKPSVRNGLRMHFRYLMRPQLLIHASPCPLEGDGFSPNASATRQDYKELHVVRHEEGWSDHPRHCCPRRAAPQRVDRYRSVEDDHRDAVHDLGIVAIRVDRAYRE
jgi:hypothetical protein